MEGSPCSSREWAVPGEGSGALLRAEPPGLRQEWAGTAGGMGMGLQTRGIGDRSVDPTGDCSWTRVCIPGGIARGMGLGLAPRWMWGSIRNGSKTATQVGPGFQQEQFWNCSPKRSGIAMQMGPGLFPCWV